MPSAPLRYCPGNGGRCTTKVTKGYCPQHTLALKAHHARYYQGGGTYGRRWRIARAAFLSEHSFCVQCDYLANVVDHRVPHRGNRDLFWDQSNWQPMCRSCHGVKTAAESRATADGRGV
jgi:5-methylcytosine-specific restriction protein A